MTDTQKTPPTTAAARTEALEVLRGFRDLIATTGAREIRFGETAGAEFAAALDTAISALEDHQEPAEGEGHAITAVEVTLFGRACYLPADIAQEVEQACVARAALAAPQQPAAPSGEAVATVAGEFSEVRQDGEVYWLQTVLLKQPQQLPFGAPLYTAPPPSAVPEGWPRATKDQRDQGWTLEYRFLERVTDLAAPRTEYSTSMEATEQVLIAALEVLATQHQEQSHEGQ